MNTSVDSQVAAASGEPLPNRASRFLFPVHHVHLTLLARVQCPRDIGGRATETAKRVDVNSPLLFTSTECEAFWLRVDYGKLTKLRRWTGMHVGW